MTDVTRRQYLGALAAGAAANWEGAEYDVENVEEWGDKIEFINIGSFDPKGFRTNADLGHAGFLVEDCHVEDPTAEVWYNDKGVSVSLEADLEDGHYQGNTGEFDPEEARELAVAIYQAAEELERWREAIDNE